MPRTLRFPLVIATAVLLTAAGCRKVVRDEANVEVPVSGVKPLDVPACRSLTVEFSASDGAQVNVYVVAKANEQAASDALEAGKPPANVLGKAEKSTSGTVTASAEAKTKMTILVTSSKSTKVNLKFRGS